MFSLCFASCGNNEEAVNTEIIESSTADEKIWTSRNAFRCSVHHSDYHLLPYNLVLTVGLDKANGWAENQQKACKNAEHECPYYSFNIKKFIDDMSITRETFVREVELYYYPAYDLDVLFGSEVAAEKYFMNVDALRTESIKAQHVAFIEKALVDLDTGKAMDMIVSSDFTYSGVNASIPQLVQGLSVSREDFEEMISKIDGKTEEICGKLNSYEYNLDLIYNPDGSFKALPYDSGKTPFENVLYLNRLFCNVGE